ncbi:MAG: molybdopterin molybdotransferase MoeA, partial [Candidatus Bathyarchaeota archaeon]|nr:molybdopterin molybdotransferase MoeA [Candidatus Bathyarchaeota archaeon]
MRPFKRLLRREAALRIIEENTRRIDRVERVPIEEAAGRMLAADAVAGFNVPPFDRSSMDGYAVRAEDTFGASTLSPKKLRLIGIQNVGEMYEGEIHQGECVQIATGSPLPKGCDAVVMVEHTRLEEDFVGVQQPVYPGANISPEGEDIKRGDTVVGSGEVLTPAKIGALAALNIRELVALEKPLVAIFSTGSEIRPLGEELQPGQIYDVNSYTLSSVISANGCTPVTKGIVPDDEYSIRAALKDASKHDLGVFSGGSSVGARDLFADAVESMGEVLFHGLQVKPGKQT